MDVVDVARGDPLRLGLKVWIGEADASPVADLTGWEITVGSTSRDLPEPLIEVSNAGLGEYTMFWTGEQTADFDAGQVNWLTVRLTPPSGESTTSERLWINAE